MQNELERFLAHPTARNYLRVRKLILQDAKLRTDPADLVQLDALFRARRYEDVRGATEQMLPAWGLSPRVYWFAAAAARELGCHEDAELDRFLYQSCLAGLLSTGDGTSSAPYRVTYLSDAAELLTWQGQQREPCQRRLVRTTRGYCDCVQCADGGERFFLLDRALLDQLPCGERSPAVRLPDLVPSATERSALR